MKDSHFDAIVVGLGIMGSATLWHLAQRGLRVCGIDRFEPPHELGSSHGDARAIRKAYFEHPDYVPLLNRAYDLWEALERESETKLVDLCGMVFAGSPEGAAIQGLERCYAAHDLPHERWTPSDTARHFPQFRIDEDHVAFWDPFGGMVYPEESIRQYVRLAEQAGATVLTGERVTDWEASEGACAVHTPSGTYHSGAIVLTAGPWTSQLLSDLGLPLTVLRKVQLWYTGPGIKSFHPGFPVWYMDKPYGGIYGFPPLDRSGVKLAEHTGGRYVSSPDRISRDLDDDDEWCVLRCISETFPDFTPARTRHSVCMYTTTPDHQFILDRHPEHPNVVFGAGFSGHGFKFAPVVGEILAGLAVDGATEHPIEFLSLERFR